MSTLPRIIACLVLLGLGAACASTLEAPAPSRTGSSSTPGEEGLDRTEVVRTAQSMIGAPYRYGGSSPAGFDCSGLVVYSFEKAGLSGLPHSAAALESLTRPIRLNELQPGDLLFFRLTGPKTTHVGIYVGDHQFVHAPSSGKRVERVSFDDVYWSTKIHRAGRLER